MTGAGVRLTIGVGGGAAGVLPEWGAQAAATNAAPVAAIDAQRMTLGGE